MDAETRRLLNRWQSLRSESGLARAKSATRILWILGLGLFIFVVIGLYYMLPPVILAVASAAVGWVIAERNALKSRITQWPGFARYIDWDRVSNDLDGK